MPAVVKRNPDGGVATAVSSIIQHQKFKRMLMFGMRSLSDFSQPSNQLYKENAADALHRNAVPAINTAVATFADDEELITFACKIMWAISEYCKEEKNAADIKQLVDGGGVTIVMTGISQTPSDGECITRIMDFIQNMNYLGVKVDAKTVAPGLLAILKKEKQHASVVSRIMAAISISVEEKAGAVAFGEQGAKQILEYCLATGDMSEASLNATASAFNICKRLAEQKLLGSDYLPLCMSLIDKYRVKKTVYTAGTEMLAAMVKVSELSKSLKDLNKHKPGSPEHEQAVSMLVCMSYISSYADEIVKAGGLAVLVHLINSGLTQIESNPDKIYRMLAGVSSMLGRIAMSPSNTDQLAKLGAVPSLCTALSYCTENLECIAAIAFALVAFSGRERDALEMVKYNTFATALPLLYTNVEAPDVATSFMELVATASTHAALRNDLLTNQAIEICSMCSQYYLTNTLYQMNIIKAFKRLLSENTTLQSIYEYGGFTGMTGALKENVSNRDFAAEAIVLLEQLSRVPDATSYMCDAELVNAILGAMLEHENEESIVKSGIACLDTIATVDDCGRHMKDLQRVVTSGTKDPDSAYHTFAAIAGLSRVSHLTNVFTQKDAAGTILKAISEWLQATPFKGQTKIIQGGLVTLKVLELNSSSSLDKVIMMLCDAVCLPQVKRLMDLQEPDDNVSIHATHCMKELAAADRVTGGDVEKCVESVMKVMKKYPDIRRIQTNCMKTLNYLAYANSGDGVQDLVKAGAIKSILTYLLRAPMYLDVQIDGFTVLATCAKVDATTAETMKKNNCLQALQVAMRTHTKSAELKRTIAPLLVLIMPEDALEAAIKERIAECEEAMTHKNVLYLNQSLGGLNDLTMTSECSRVAARCNVGPAMKAVQTWVIKNKKLYSEAGELPVPPQDYFESTMGLVAANLANLAESRAGLTHLTKSELTPVLLESTEQIGRLAQYTEEWAESVLLALKGVLRYDRGNAEVAFDKGLLPKMKYLLDTIGTPGVLVNTCGCIAGMSTTPKRVGQIVARKEFGEILVKLMQMIQKPPDETSQVAALSAVEDLLLTKEPQMVEKIVKADNSTGLLKVIERCAPPEAVKIAARCMCHIDETHKLRETYKSDIRSTNQILTTALLNHKNDESTILPVMDAINRLTTSADKLALKECGTVDVVADILTMHKDPETLRIGGEILSKMGADEQIKAIMQQIIQTVEAGDPDIITRVNTLCERLAMFLSAPLDNPEDALQFTEGCLASITACLAAAPDDIRLQASAALVSRRLCDRCFEDTEDAFGAWAVTSTGMGLQYCNMLADANIVKSKKMLMSVFPTLSACAYNPYCNPTLQESVPMILPEVLKILENNKTDVELTGKVLEFLYYLSLDPQTAKLLANAKGPAGTVIEAANKSMNMHLKHDAVVVPSMRLMAQMGIHASTEGYPLPKVCLNGTVLKDGKSAVLASPTVSRQGAYMGLMEGMLLAGVGEEVFLEAKSLETAIKQCKLDMGPGRLKLTEKHELALGMSSLLNRAANHGLANQCKKFGARPMIGQLMEEYYDDAVVLANCINSLKGLSTVDAIESGIIATENVPWLISNCNELIQTDAACEEAFIDLLEALSLDGGTARQCAGVEGLDDVLQGIERHAEQYGDEHSRPLKEKISKLKKTLDDAVPKERTLRHVHDEFVAMIEKGESLSVVDVPAVKENVDFLFSKLGMYFKEKLDSTKALGVDAMWGLKAFSLLFENSANIPPCIDAGFPVLVLTGISKQTDADIVRWSTRALNAFTNEFRGAEAIVKSNNSVNIITDALATCHSNKRIEKKDPHIIDILIAVDHTALNRNVYNKTKIMKGLVDVWNQCDSGGYEKTVLRHTFRSMRKVVSDAHVEVLLKANVINRLIAIINGKEIDATLFPDVLFLLGSLAIVPEIKTKVGELGGVDACTNLLKRSITDEKLAAVTTNCCLALANFCIAHKKNADIFYKLKGPALNVQVLDENASVYDVVNAGSVLLCNLMYKNESMKKAFGSNGAAESLVKALQQYDGSIAKNAIRCLESLFKAISNMSLLTKNIRLFVDAGIELSYKTWLENLDSSFPNRTLETGLKTLCNLVTENDEGNMKKFGVCVAPLLGVMKHGRDDVVVLALLFEIQASLCRLPKNAAEFAKLDGIETSVDTIHQYDYDIPLLVYGIYLLSIQAMIPDNIPRLLAADVFSIYIGSMEVDLEESEAADLVIGSLRCSRRLIQSDELAYMYCEAGGIAGVASVICRSIEEPLIMLEACRVLLALLAHTHPTIEDEQAWKDTLMQNRGVGNDAIEPVASWYYVGMDEAMIDALCQAVCACASIEQHSRQLRLQRALIGLCTYFISANVAIDALMGYGFEQIMSQCLNVFPGELTLINMAITAINNISNYSGDLCESIRSSELATALRSAIPKIADKKPEEKECRANAQKTLDALLSGLDPFDAFAGLAGTMDFNATQWDVDPYPNGVQDLPAALKETLRKGGKLKVFLGDKNREDITWRGSQDLAAFEWNYDGTDEYPNRVAIVKMRNISKGLTHPALQKANQAEPRKVTAKLCLCIFGPSTEDFPKGLELPLKAKSTKDRDVFVEQLVQWRDAATYNY